MKIIYCLQNLSLLGGTESIISTKASHFSDLGHDVTILLDDHLTISPLLTINPSVHIVDCGIQYFDNHKPFPWNIPVIISKHFKQYKALKCFCQKNKPDVIVSVCGQSWRILPFVRGPWIIIREMHSDAEPRAYMNRNSWWSAIKRFKMNYYNKKYDQVVVLTKGEKELYGSPTNTCVIPNPVRFHSCGRERSHENNLVISIGRLDELKNHSSLLRAAKAVVERYPDSRFELYGEGPSRIALLSEIISLNLENRFFLRNNTSDIQTKLLHSSLLVHTSRFETFSLAILEALACGVPVIAYDCPFGPREIIDNGITGFLVPFGDENALVERICYLLERPDIRKRMSEEAFNKAAQFDIKRIAPLWISMFNSLILKKQKIKM